MYNVLVTARAFGRFSQVPYEILKKAGCQLIANPWAGQKLSEAELLELIPQADALICGEDPVTAKVLSAATCLKVVSKFGVGVDQIDINAATARGIVVCNTPGANSESVADMAFALMLGVARNLPRTDREVRAGAWNSIVGCELFGKTLGIVGLGRIGKAVAKRAQGFSMNILAYDEYPDKEFAQKNEIIFTDFEDLLKKSDFVSLHVPAAKDTKALVGAKELALMKETAYLINTARGEVVDEAALHEALKTGKLAGAGLDVFTKEPPDESPLFSLDNVVLAPHIAAHTVDAINNMGTMSAENAVTVLSGHKSVYELNSKALGREG